MISHHYWQYTKAGVGLTEIKCAVWDERLTYFPCSVLFVVVGHFYDLCYKVLDIITIMYSAMIILNGGGRSSYSVFSCDLVCTK